MTFKSIRKNTGRFFGWLGLVACSGIIRFLPARFLYGFARLLSFVGYRVASKQRRIALESLTVAFKEEKSPAEREQIARECFSFMAKAAIELLFLMERPDMLRGRVKITNRHILERALTRGRGVILVSAHFGNFPLMLARLALEGYKTAGIMRPMRDGRVEAFFGRKRKSLNIKTIYSQPRNACVYATIDALRNNEMVFIPLDQNFGTGGVSVEFFGRRAATATGPVVLAQRTGARLLPCFIIRRPGDYHEIVFEEPITIRQAADPRDTLRMNIQFLTGVIERYIRRYPAEWGWIHRRWKSEASREKRAKQSREKEG